MSSSPIFAEESQIRTSFWKQPSLVTPPVFAQFENYYYAPSDQYSSYESRINLGVDTHFKYGENFSLAMKAHFIGSLPKESSGWGSVESAYVEWHKLFKSSISFVRFGRILPSWGGPDEYSPIKKLFPYYTVDPLNSHPNGMLGLYTLIQEDLMDFEFLASPIFIPNLGGPIYKTDSSGKFYSPSRWAVPMYYVGTIGTATVPINYKLYTPKISDVIFKAGVAARITFKDFYDQYKISALIMSSYDPEPRLRTDGDLNIKDNDAIQGNENFFPEFYRHVAYAFEGEFKLFGIEMLLESLFRVPENPDGLPENLQLAQEWKSLIAFQTKNDKSLWPQLMVGLVSTQRYHPYVDPSYKIPTPSLNNIIEKLTWQPFSKISLFSSSEIAATFKQSLIRNGVEWMPSGQFKISSGLDSITGKDDTYWGQFRDNDRIWLRGEYDF